jgi:hypothetical protein
LNMRLLKSTNQLSLSIWLTSACERGFGQGTSYLALRILYTPRISGKDLSFSETKREKRCILLNA